MWNLISSNRILQRRNKTEAYDKHLLTLRKIKSQINNCSPNTYHFLSFRQKARQLQHQRKKQIECNNNILVRKMMTTTSSLGLKDDFVMKNSLNQSVNKKKRQRQIDDQNQILVKKLYHVESEYSNNALKKSVRDYQNIKSNLYQSRITPMYDLQKPMASYFYRRRPQSAKR